jgi:hypothetical protein
MPRGDITGPPQGGRGGGTGAGRGLGRGGKMEGNRAGAGPGGDCVCPSCGAKVAHKVATPCYEVLCLKCGTKMTRG